MPAIDTERVIAIRHWTNTQFTVTTTRQEGLRFENGQFVMVGLNTNGLALLRPHSIASANHEEHLEFLSIKVPEGPFTSRLHNLKLGDEILVSRKPTGTLVLSALRPGKRLYLLCTGTGVAPFLSLLKCPQLYDRFEQIILVHGVRWAKETEVVHDRIRRVTLHGCIGSQARAKLRYYPAVTREPHMNRGRITNLLEYGQLRSRLGLPPLDPGTDRAMVCGSPAMLADTCILLDRRGFAISRHIGETGDYVIERVSRPQ